MLNYSDSIYQGNKSVKSLTSVHKLSQVLNWLKKGSYEVYHSLPISHKLNKIKDTLKPGLIASAHMLALRTPLHC